MLKIVDFKVSIEKKLIVKGVDLKVKPGEIHVIMGPNGGGKSSLVYALAGHPNYKVDGGQFVINKKNFLEMAPNERVKNGLFLGFQNPIGVEGVTVEQILKRAGYIKKMNVLEFREMLQKKAKKLGLKKELIKESVNSGFSGGEKKRMEILQMEVLRPQYAVLDEVDSGLDIDGIKLVAKGIEHRAKRGTGVLLITHYQRILKYLSVKKIHIMIDGKIKESGKQELLNKLERGGYGQFIS